MNKLVVLLTLLMSFNLAFANVDAALDAWDAGDEQAAFNGLSPLAEKGDARAQLYLGLLYGEGSKIGASQEKREYWLKKSAENGSASGQFFYGMTFVEEKYNHVDHTEALKWLGQAADQAHPDALNMMSIMYLEGWGVKPDLVKSYAYALLAVKAGDDSVAPKNVANVKGKLTAQQIEQAEKLAEDWLKGKPL